MTFSRLSGAAAMGFVLTAVAATAILQSAGLPAMDASPEEVSTFFADHATQVAIASALAPLAWVMLALFGAGAAARLLPAERPRGEAWSLVGLIGLVMNIIFFGGSVVTQIALRVGTSATDGLWSLHNAFFTINGVSLATALIGFSIAGLRTRTMRTWHGTIGLLAAALQLTQAALSPIILDGGPSALSIIGLVGFLLWLLWLITFGVILFRDATSTAVTGREVSVPAR